MKGDREEPALVEPRALGDKLVGDVEERFREQAVISGDNVHGATLVDYEQSPGTVASIRDRDR